MAGAVSQPRVLSIQSHIVHGNLGNKCAVFPLQLLGFEVDNISTVQYSHMGAGRTGSTLSATDFTTLIDGLDAQGLLGQYTHILTGWAAEGELLGAIAAAVRRIRSVNPAVVYLCDPVLGDHGALYTPEGLAEIYRDQLLPLATIVTPNSFEAELLTDLPCTTLEDGAMACKALQAAGVRDVLITSIERPQTIALVGLSASAADAGFVIEVPKHEQYFGGTGDLLAGLLLAQATACSEHFSRAAARAVGSVQAVIGRTLEVRKETGHSESGLQLVASRDLILNPQEVQCISLLP
jgi:pyridoxine kinase